MSCAQKRIASFCPTFSGTQEDLKAGFDMMASTGYTWDVFSIRPGAWHSLSSRSSVGLLVRIPAVYAQCGVSPCDSHGLLHNLVLGSHSGPPKGAEVYGIFMTGIHVPSLLLYSIGQSNQVQGEDTQIRHLTMIVKKLRV